MAKKKIDMALLGKKTQFKPGQSGNPGGRPKLPEDLMNVKKLTKEHVSKLINKFGAMPTVDLEQIVKTPESPSLDVMICSAMLRAINDGDVTRMEFLLNRTIGKVTDVSEIHSKYDAALDEVPQQNIIEMLKVVNKE